MDEHSARLRALIEGILYNLLPMTNVYSVLVDGDTTLAVKLAEVIASLNTKAKQEDLPTKLSQLENDTNFVTNAVSDLVNYYDRSETCSREEIVSLISEIPKFSISVVSDLPASEISETTIYLVPGGENPDVYTEYLYVDSRWEILGSQKIDLTGYAREDWVNSELAKYQPKGNYALASNIPTRLTQLENDAGYISGYTESDPTVPAWAKRSSPPTYTKGDVGLSNVENVKQYSANNPPPYPVKSVNGKVGDVNVVETTKENVETALGYTPADVEDVFESALQPTFTNIFDTVGIEYGKMLETDGSVADTATALCVTDFIPVSAGDVIRVNEDFQLYCVTGANTPKVVVYDASFAKLTHTNNTGMVEGGYYIELLEKNADGHIVSFRVNKPSAAAYIRICNNTTVVGKNPVLTINEEITYEVGYGTKLNPKVRVDQSQILNAPVKNGWSILPNEHLNICYSGINRKPINTVEHFTDAATNFGYNALKCDVRPTSDGELVCCHDAGFTFDSSGYITTYNASNSTVIHNVTAATVLGYSFKTGEHPCLVGDYLDVCRKYGKVAFVTIRNEYMDVVIPKLLDELRIHNMTHATIINCMTYESLVQWRAQDQTVMINYTLNFGVAIDQTQIDRAVGLGYCSLSGFSLSSSAAAPSASCDFAYARANGIRLLEAIAYHADSPETCYDMGYDGVTIGIPWNPVSSGGGSGDSYSRAEIDSMMGSYINDVDSLLGGG